MTNKKLQYCVVSTCLKWFENCILSWEAPYYTIIIIIIIITIITYNNNNNKVGMKDVEV
jgi:hypothetical protein